MDFGIGSVTAITAICYLGGMACKATTKVKDEVIPVICGVTGGILGVAGMYLSLIHIQMCIRDRYRDNPAVYYILN